MNRHDKLQTAIDEILELNFIDDDTLFIQTIPAKLQHIHSLMEFTTVTNQNFHNYLALFQNDILVDIDICRNHSNTTEEKIVAFQKVKQHATTRLKAVEFAAVYFLRSKTFLFVDEADKKNMLKKKAKHIQINLLHNWLFNTHKQKTLMAKSAGS